MKTALEKQGITDYKSITIRRDGEEMQTQLYILTFNKSIIPKGIIFGYYFKKVVQYTPAPLRCFKC